MEIKQILDDNQFKAITALVIDMYKSIDSSITEFGAVNTFMHYMRQEDFILIGLYEKDTLVGITFGHKFRKKSFIFCGIYVIIKNNRHLKSLIDFSFATIKEKGYDTWLVDATNPNITSIMQKYNATIKHVRLEGAL